MISIKSANLSWNDMRLELSGTVKPWSQNRLWLDMDMAANAVELDHLIQELKGSNENQGHKTAPETPPLPVQGNIRFKTDRFTFSDFTWNPLQADISLNNDTAAVTVKEAVICGISMPGTLKVSPNIFQYSIKPIAKDRELNPTLRCFTKETLKADGKYTLKGSFQGHGKAKGLLKTSTGHVELTVAKGHIYRDIVVSKVLKFLNVSEMLTGQVDEQQMETKGFGYHSFRAKANLKNGKIRFDDAVLNGDEMTITGAGEYDLLDGRSGLTLLVAPQKTLDSILRHIPLIGGILHTLDTIPLGVTGTYDDIAVHPLAPSAVGYALKESMKNAVGVPIKLRHIDETPGRGSDAKP